ncbi:MAG: hypothetical protein HUJ68_09990 [Clostridia bacterium]|nr:hypothetical protein [Clostridia bacterium]
MIDENDNFPVIKEEDGGFAIYVNGEKREWYDNIEDAEGVANCMIDDEFSEVFQESKKNNLKESISEYYSGEKFPVYTGLAYKNEYASIISSVNGQIWDGIGESDSREGKIFNYYYKCLTGVSTTSENDELVVWIPTFADDVEILIRCIWRIAQIERNYKGTKNKNMYYYYLNADWKSICALQAALNKAPDTKPWTQEEHDKVMGRVAARQAAAEAKAAAEKKEAEEKAAKAKADKEAKVARVQNSIKPDAKDIMRAETAWKRADGDAWKYDQLLDQQLNKITEPGKAERRIVAFYEEFLNHADEVKNFDDKIKWFTNRMEDIADKVPIQESFGYADEDKVARLADKIYQHFGRYNPAKESSYFQYIMNHCSNSNQARQAIAKYKRLGRGGIY